jgi:dTDP-4-dehydrorhamnose reductase
MARAANVYGATLVHFSTDYAVTQTSKTEAMEELKITESFSVYGHTKREGEEAVLSACPGNALILRLSSIYDSADMAGSLDAIKQVRAGKGTPEDPVKVLEQYTTPTPTRWIVEQTIKLIEKLERDKPCYSRIINVVPRGPVWKRSFARSAIRLFLDKDATVLTGELPLERPKFSVLSPSLMETMLGDIAPTCSELLEQEAAAWHTEECSRSPRPA